MSKIKIAKVDSQNEGNFLNSTANEEEFELSLNTSVCSSLTWTPCSSIVNHIFKKAAITKMVAVGKSDCGYFCKL